MRELLLVLLVVGCSSTGGGDGSDAATDAPSADEASDASEAGPPSCDGTKTGVDQGHVSTTAKTNVLVRTPSGYDPTVSAPLIVVYAACCADGATMEAFTMLTPPATSRGYMIAYVDHITPTTTAAYNDAASAVAAISASYCVDPRNVFLTGHSDGGSLDEILALQGLVATNAIAPSASGALASQLTPSSCPASAVSVFEQHSSGDTLFPISQGYGPPMAAWWAACDGCGAQGPARSDGCIPYQSCSGELQVLYCQGTAAHGVWPNRDGAILDFFDQYRVP